MEAQASGASRLTEVGTGATERWLFHLAVAEEWAEAVARGAYERSTLGRSLAEEGFIHCSFRDQVQPVADRIHRGRDDVVLLRIDRHRLDAEVRVENLDGGTERFPHVYGALPVHAVVGVDEVPVARDGRLLLRDLLDPSR